MAERKYSVSEIDRMRRAVAWCAVGPRESAAIEDRLRTYMLNGTDPEELEEAAKPFIEKDRIWQERVQYKFRPGGITPSWACP